ncbi:kelch-like protein 28 [Arctopsyche grandis]|uniref:kelch-like protein 28 n=1 Tax=Arctopsyche grandis TaxID=121162 RepID=UPI00406DA29B
MTAMKRVQQKGMAVYYNVHLVVLSACSEFFGRNENNFNETFSPFDFNVIDVILKYCYTGEISIDDHQYKKYMELANLLEVKVPPRYETVDLSNYLAVLKLTGDPELKKKAMDLTLEIFETNARFSQSTSLHCDRNIKILNVPSEENVFNSVKFWVNYDDASRKNDLVNLISYVSLSLLSIKFLVEEVIKFFNSCADCMTSLRLAILDKISLNSKSLNQRETRRRKKSANTIDVYDGEEKNWILLKDIGIIKNSFASVIAGDWIIIIGGMNSSNYVVNLVKFSGAVKLATSIGIALGQNYVEYVDKGAGIYFDPIGKATNFK